MPGRGQDNPERDLTFYKAKRLVIRQDKEHMHKVLHHCQESPAFPVVFLALFPDPTLSQGETVW